jgi:hypothetical protein
MIDWLIFNPWARLTGTRAQSGDRYDSGTLHSGQVLRSSLPLLSPTLNAEIIYKAYTISFHLCNFYKPSSHFVKLCEDASPVNCFHYMCLGLILTIVFGNACVMTKLYYTTYYIVILTISRSCKDITEIK